MDAPTRGNKNVIHAKFATMGKNEIDIAVIFERIKNIEDGLEKGFGDIMRALSTKADKEQIDSKIKPIERNQNIIMGIIISMVVAGVIGFMLRYGLGL